MDFPAWAALIRDELRARLPAITSTRRATDAVVFRFAGRTATLTRGGSWNSVSFTSESGAGTTMASLTVEQIDAFTARNVAKTIAGFFDAELSGPEKKP